MSLSLAMWVILYSDFSTRGERECVCEITRVTRDIMCALLKVATDLHRYTNSFVQLERIYIYINARVYTYIYTVAYIYKCVSPFECRSPMHDAVSLLYAPKLVCTWYRPRDRMTRFNAFSLSLPVFVPLDSPSFVFVVFFFLYPPFAESAQISRESPRAHLIRSFVPRYLLSQDSISDDCRDDVQQCTKDRRVDVLLRFVWNSFLAINRIYNNFYRI